MICLAELACLVFGIAILITVMANGSFPIGNKELRGAPAYIVSLLLIAVLPIALLIGCGLGVDAVQKGKQAPDIDETKLALIELGIVFGCAIPALIIALAAAKKKRKKKKKKRRPAEYDDYDDEPRRGRIDDEDDDRPSRRRFEDDDDDRPRRRRFDEDEDDDRPRRRRFDDD